MCQGVPPVKSFDNFNETIPEAYVSNLDTSVASKDWPSRAPNLKLSDVYLSDSFTLPIKQVIISEVEENKKHLIESATSGYYKDKDGKLHEVNIDLLGDMTEASVLSVNPEYYGSLGIHNIVHLLISLVHYPKFNISVFFF